MNLLTVSFGICEAWSSSAVLLLTSDLTPLPSGKITIEEASWIVSILRVGGLFGNIFFGYITSKFGRKIPLIVITVPTIVSEKKSAITQNESFCKLLILLIKVFNFSV